MATSKTPQTAPSATPTLAGLIAAAKPAQLISRRASTPKTTETLPLVKDCEGHLLGPMPITLVRQVMADIRASADQLNYGVKVQVQTLDGTKIAQNEVKDVEENTPTAQVNIAFQGSTVRKTINRKPKENTPSE